TTINLILTASKSKKLKMMNKKILLAVLAAALLTVPAFAQKANKLSKNEKKAGWELLFNGKNFDGWRQYAGETMPANWTIEDDAMKVFLGEGKNPGQGAGGDIIFSDRKFKNFELSIDWKAGDMANSGIFYYVKEEPGKPIYYAAPEVQVLDNENATDNKIDSHLAGSLYDMIAADPKTVNQ